MPGCFLRRFRLVIFDLDGTLIDSREDLAYSVNLALARMGFAAISQSRIIEFVGEGAALLMRRALAEAAGTEPDLRTQERAVALMLEEYGRHLLDTTRLYEGVREVLQALDWAGIAVVTNKPEAFARTILKGLGLEERFCAVLGGDSPVGRKPDPAPLLEAMSRCGVPPGETLMVGDSRIDIAAGKAAGVTTCGVTGGFRARAELETAGCDLLIDSLAELTGI